uniref:SHSP domain-containing protein n=1 Tax=Araucaria cunninghamii TaxID=56994 RepID=A0A0D6R0A5_ARACU
MAIVPVFRRGGEGDMDIVPWNADPLEEGGSLVDSFFRRGSLFDPFVFGSRFLDPFEAFPLWDYTPSSLYAKDAEAVAHTYVDWWESADAHIIQVDLPGATKDGVEVLVENGRVLQISGRSKRVEPPGGGRRRRGERSRAGYFRRLSLPANVDAQQLKAEMDNGVLTITIPKLSASTEESAEYRVVEVED